MTEFESIEFSFGPNKRDLYIHQNGGFKLFDETCTDLIDYLFDRIKDEYPHCFAALKEIYSNSFHFKYLYIRRFIRCNFSISDEILDINFDDHFNFEFIACPVRGECRFENIICNPKFNSTLTEREIEVVKLIARNLSDEEISGQLFLSYHTVCNHRRNILRKLGARNKQAIYEYAINHNML